MGEATGRSGDLAGLGALAGRWTLTAVDGAPFELAGRLPMLEIRDDGSAGGVSGVNRFMTKLDATLLAEGRISFGRAASTRMAGPPEAMAFEQSFLERLSAVSSFTIDGGTLRLWAGDAEVLAFGRDTE